MLSEPGLQAVAAAAPLLHRCCTAAANPTLSSRPPWAHPNGLPGGPRDHQAPLAARLGARRQLAVLQHHHSIEGVIHAARHGVVAVRHAAAARGLDLEGDPAQDGCKRAGGLDTGGLLAALSSGCQATAAKPRHQAAATTLLLPSTPLLRAPEGVEAAVALEAPHARVVQVVHQLQAAHEEQHAAALHQRVELRRAGGAAMGEQPLGSCRRY